MLLLEGHAEFFSSRRELALSVGFQPMTPPIQGFFVHAVFGLVLQRGGNGKLRDGAERWRSYRGLKVRPTTPVDAG